jgi:DNA-binding MarR family transcriptional regulator
MVRIKDVQTYNLDESIPYLMNRVVGRQNRLLEEDLHELGLGFQHWRVLAVLARGDGVSIADLAAYAVVPHSTLSRLLDRLESDKLVKRSSNTPDGRTACLLITARGKEVYQRILPMAIQRRDDALVGFTRPEKDLLLEMLHRMLANLQEPGPAR